MRAPGAESVRSLSGSSTWLESSIEKFFTIFVTPVTRQKSMYLAAMMSTSAITGGRGNCGRASLLFVCRNL